MITSQQRRELTNSRGKILQDTRNILNKDTMKSQKLRQFTRLRKAMGGI